MPTDLLIHIDGSAAWIELAEPQRGCPLNLRTVAQLAAAIAGARAADCAVVVLASSGRAFSVGGDIKDFAAAADPGAYIDELAHALHAVILELHALDAIVISVVQGVAAGAGFPLAAAADLVIAGESATFTLAYNKIGLTPDGGSSLLTSTLGFHRTMALALLNPLMTASEAHSAGLVSAVHPDGEVTAAVRAVVETLLAGSRSAQVGTKRLLRGRALPLTGSDLDLEASRISAAADGPDGREGVRAFVEKRAPHFG
ncbi:2-(1,2-epoxy-1,2-dihydrophenyl)acetyl-CoA isomerase [Nakamurella sp. UYEF19]|uniref:enoyl-CoA hydratase-related protein n=1 Tax=Nakamurella sp. UYEF19 TaxID=1756392 RepID=UPI0033960A69